MGRGKHYSVREQERIIELLECYRSLPQAIREIGGRPSERTCRRWIAERGLFAKGYREYHRYHEMFRIARGIQRDAAQLGYTKGKTYFETMRRLEAGIREDAEQMFQLGAKGDCEPVVNPAICHGAQLAGRKNGQTVGTK